jgi:lipopolysaccharide transport system permease protein
MEIVYSSESHMRRPGQLLATWWHDMRVAGYLASRFLVRDLKSQYRQSLLGAMWAFIPPVVFAVGLTLAKDANVLNIGETSLPYAVYVMVSMTLWQTFAEALQGPFKILKKYRTLLTKINFPREALILSKMGEIGLGLLIKLALIVALFVGFHVPVTAALLLAPLALGMMVAFGLAIGLVIAPLGLLYQDIEKGLPVALGIWLLLTPVLYPAPTRGLFGAIVHWNPMSALLTTTRELATTGVVTDGGLFGLWSAVSLVGLLLGWLFLRLSMPYVTERVG